MVWDVTLTLTFAGHGVQLDKGAHTSHESSRTRPDLTDVQEDHEIFDLVSSLEASEGMHRITIPEHPKHT